MVPLTQIVVIQPASGMDDLPDVLALDIHGELWRGTVTLNPETDETNYIWRKLLGPSS